MRIIIQKLLLITFLAHYVVNLLFNNPIKGVGWCVYDNGSVKGRKVEIMSES
jgi:hypothetical protein